MTPKSILKHIKSLDPLDVLVFVVIVTMVATFIVTLSRAGFKVPQDYRYDPATGVTTWTDDEGRRLMKDENGNVRELSK